jgi:hypothetical protein
MSDVVQIGDELDEDGLVEAEARLERRNRFHRRRAGLTSQHVSRVSGRKLQQEKIDHYNSDHGGNRLPDRATKNLRYTLDVRHDFSISPAASTKLLLE